MASDARCCGTFAISSLCGYYQDETSFYDDTTRYTVTGLCRVATWRACDNGMQPMSMTSSDMRGINRIAKAEYLTILVTCFAASNHVVSSTGIHFTERIHDSLVM